MADALDPWEDPANGAAPPAPASPAAPAMEPWEAHADADEPDAPAKDPWDAHADDGDLISKATDYVDRIVGAAKTGVAAANARYSRAERQLGQMLHGQAPTYQEPSAAEQDPLLKPFEWGSAPDANTLPKVIAQSAEGLVGSTHLLAGGAAGGAVGAEAGTAGGPAAPITVPAGAAIGAALGTYAASYAMDIAPMYADELHATPNDPRGAFERAFAKANSYGVINGVTFGMLSKVPGGQTLKEGIFNYLTKTFPTLEASTGLQREASNVIDGKPAGEGVLEDMAQAAPANLALGAGERVGHIGRSDEAAAAQTDAQTQQAVDITKSQQNVDQIGQLTNAEPWEAHQAIEVAPAEPPSAQPRDLEETPLPPETPAAEETPAEPAPEVESTPEDARDIPEPEPASEGSGTREDPAVVQTDADMQAARDQVDTDPSDAQKEAGNYQKGHVRWNGLDITIENPRGSTRSGTDANGEPWSVKMPADYGYIKRTEDGTGEQVDVYMGPRPDADLVYVLDQHHPDSGEFDEYKAMLGFPSAERALNAYDGAFSDDSGPDRRRNVTPMTVDQFKDWVKNGETQAPLAEQEAADIAPPDRRAVYDNMRDVMDRAGIGDDVALQLVDHMEAEISGRASPMDGSYFDRMIKLATDDPARIEPAAYHEILHGLRDLNLIPAKDWALLANKSDRVWRDQYDIDSKYAGEHPDILAEEGVAHALADYRRGQLQEGGMAGRALRKVSNFLDALGNWARGYGFRSADDVFDKLMSGRGAREARAQQARAGVTEGPRFAVRDDERRTFGIPKSADPPIRSYIHTGGFKDHPDYAAAKAGDDAAAVRFVQDMVKPETIEEAARRFGPDAVYAPVIAQEATGQNSIPRVLAEYYAAKTGARVNDDVVQANRAFHTGANAMDRLISRPRFDGSVEKGKRYVLVDDASVLGGTIAELAHHIQAGGGKIAGVVTLADASRTGVYSPLPAHVRTVESRFGDTVRSKFGIEPRALTAAEAKYLANFRDADNLRARIAKAEGERDGRLRSKGVRDVPVEPTNGAEEHGARGAGEVRPDQAGLKKPERQAVRDEIERQRGFADKLNDFKDWLTAGKDWALSAKDVVKMATNPMSMGTNESRAAAKDFANAMRAPRFELSRLDDLLLKEFTPEQRRAMWDAADKDSVALQTGKKAKARGQLPEKERQVTAMLQDDSTRAWERIRQLGVVEGNPLPSYVPHMMVNVVDGKVSRLGADRGGMSALDQVGRNLRTSSSNLKHREHMTAEEGEEAARQKFGRGATVVRDIRTLPFVTARLREVAAGRELVNAIKEIGSKGGFDAVTEGAPPAGEEDRYFTIEHPSLKTWKPELAKDPESGKWSQKMDADGNPIFRQVPLYIHKSFEGPLRAVLSKDSNSPAMQLYRGLMNLKGKAMSTILWSPAIHAGVVFGKAFPAMPGKMLTARFWIDANQARQNIPFMRQAIEDGLVPIGGHGAMQDITSIAEQPQLTPGRSWTAKVLGAVPGLFDPRAGDAVKRGVDKFGNFWHNTLLWDRVQQLQVGLYKGFRERFAEDGMDQQTAGRVAAHLANRYAGSIPLEAMSTGARMISNMMLFSRSFTLGNLGMVKDAISGLPADIRSQIERDAGKMMGDKANSLMRRKAASTLALDFGMSVLFNSLIGSAAAIAMRGVAGDDWWDKLKSFGAGVPDEALQYMKRLHALTQSVKEDPSILLNPLSTLLKLTPMGDNEPGKEDRVKVGHAPDGTAIYARFPFGKAIEDTKNWVFHFPSTLKSKMSPFVKPVFDLLANDQGFGRKLYDPYDDTPATWARNVGDIAMDFAKGFFPENTLESLYNLAKGKGDKTVSGLQTVGPLLGVTFSKGARGGEALGEIYNASDEHSFQVQRAMPGIKQKIQDGDISGAVTDMNKIGMSKADINKAIRSTVRPPTLSKQRSRDFERYATPEQKRRLEQAQGRAAAP